jgi:ADP-heptose:LPS heptosyltransferase
MSGPRAALLIKVDTLGDLVLFAPVLRTLRTAWPQTRLAVVIRRAYVDLGPLLAPGIEWWPTTLDPFGNGPAADATELARLRDAADALQPEVIAAATSRRNWLEIVLAAGAPAARRVALGASAADDYFDTQLRVEFGVDSSTAFSETVSIPPAEPDWQRNYALVDALLGRAVERTAPSLDVPDSARAAAATFLVSKNLPPRGFVVCAAAGFANVRIKTWPADRFAAAIAHLRERHRCY